MVGLLSILPSVLDRTMESLLSFLKVTDDIKDALLADENGDQTAKKGMLYAILNATKNVELGAWHDTNKSCQAINIDYDRFCGIYSEAIKFSQEYESAVSHAA